MSEFNWNRASKDAKDVANVAQENLTEAGKTLLGGLKKGWKSVSQAVQQKDFPTKEDAKKAVTAVANQAVSVAKATTEKTKEAIDALPHDGDKVDINKTGEQVVKAIKKTGEDTVKKVQNTIDDLPKDQDGKIDAKETVKKFGANILDATEQNLRDQEESKRWTQEVLQEIAESQKQFNLSIYSALTLMYCVINADNRVSAQEEKEFESICRQMDPDCDAASVLAHLQELNTKLTVQELIDKAIADSKQPDEKTEVNPRLALWDLIVVAYSDEGYSSAEKDMISDIRTKLEIDEAMQMEMEQSYQTIMALRKEKEEMAGLRLTAQEQQDLGKALEQREAVIRGSIEALITD